MEKISWTDHVRNEDVLLRVKEQRNILHEISKRKANWIGHILRRNIFKHTHVCVCVCVCVWLCVCITLYCKKSKEFSCLFF